MLNLNGVFTALITPFTDDNQVDVDSLRGLVKRQLDAGVHGLVPLGSTGEAATVTFEERETVIKTVVSEVAGQVPVIVGAGNNNTAESIRLVAQAKALGADAAMPVTPYYNKPQPEGVFQHYKAIGEAVDLPLLAYNVPGRTGMNLDPDAAERLSELPFMVGLKEASANMIQVVEIIGRTQRNWSIVSGEDQLFFSILASGGTGIICTTSNVAPRAFVNLYEAFASGDYDGARHKQFALQDLIKVMFCQTNPVPAKAACALMGLCGGRIRLPLVELDPAYLPRLSEAMAAHDLL